MTINWCVDEKDDKRGAGDSLQSAQARERGAFSRHARHCLPLLVKTWPFVSFPSDMMETNN